MHSLFRYFEEIELAATLRNPRIIYDSCQLENTNSAFSPELTSGPEDIAPILLHNANVLHSFHVEKFTAEPDNHL